MKDLETYRMKGKEEMRKAKKFIETYNVSLPMKVVTLYVFLLFSIVMTFVLLPIQYMYHAVRYHVFMQFNSITPNDDIFTVTSYESGDR